MTHHIASHRGGFPLGFTAVTRCDDPAEETGISFGVLRLAAGAAQEVLVRRETAWLLLEGALEVAADELQRALERRSLFDESASAVHAPAGARVRLAARTASELLVFETGNERPFRARLFSPRDVPDENRGRGTVRDAAWRRVRTVFDRSNSEPAVELVLGEVVTFPGRWSSYPPHHHAQPEIYHYRFTRPEGFGHAELGEQVVKVRPFDTIRIPAGLDHAQCAAPGYGMYYSWVIRHLPGNPYGVPEFTAEHRWTQDPAAGFWWPKDVP